MNILEENTLTVCTHVFVNSRLLVDHIILQADESLTHEEAARFIEVLRMDHLEYSDEAALLNV